MLKISNNFASIDKAMSLLRSDLEREGLRLGINRTLQRGSTEATRAITAEYAIKAKDARAQLRVTAISRKGGKFVLRGELEAFGVKGGHSSRNVMMFGARPAPGRKTQPVRFQTPQGWRTRNVPIGGGVSVKIKKAGARKVIEGAFIGNKGRTVFIRDNSSRLPIKAVETIDVPQMFNTRTVNRRVLNRMAEILDVEVQRGLALALARFRSGGG